MTTPRFFTEKELVTFGNYLLSKARKKSFEAHPDLGKKRLRERLSEVHHADVENFKALIS